MICAFPHARHFLIFARISLYFVKGMSRPKGGGGGGGGEESCERRGGEQVKGNESFDFPFQPPLLLNLTIK